MSKSDSICVVITVVNEAAHMGDCIDNARTLTNNIVVVDTESSDATPAIAASMGVPVYTFPYMTYVEPSRTFALSKADADWMFILDADERFTPDLIEEIRNTIAVTNKTHFKVRRNNIFAGLWPLQHGGWNNDAIIRLIRKDAFVDWPAAIHSTPVIKGECGLLQGALDHHFHPNLENMVEKTAVYEHIESGLLMDAGRSVSTPIFFRKFLGELYRRLIKFQGFRDGQAGIIESIYQAFSKTITYLYLFERKLEHEKSTSL